MSSLVKARKSNFMTFDTEGRQAVSVDEINPDGHGLATEAKQDDMIDLLQGETPALNRTKAIPVQIMVGDGGANYDALRANGQDLLVMVDDMNPDVALNSGLARSDKQDTLNASLASVGTDELRVEVISGTVGVGDVRIKGNDGNDGAGTDRIMKTDANGVVQVAGSVTTSISDVVIKGNDGNDGSGTDRTIKTDGNGAVIVDPSKEGVVSADGTTTALHSMMLGNNSGNLRTIKCDGNGVVSVDGSASTQPVSGTVTANAGSGTFAVSAASLPLPSGASTAAKQPALGTAGTASADVITVQGISSMTALVVDGSASTQPVSGTVTANAGTGTFAVSAASLPLPSGAATEATLSNAEGHLGTIDTSTASVATTVFEDGDAVGATADGLLMMGKDNSNLAHPVRITANGDVEVEIADFVKGQDTKANSFPVVLASDTDTLTTEQSYSYSSEIAIINAVSIADGANSTSASFEIQSVKVQDPIITFTVDSGGSTNYDVQAIGSQDGTNFFDIGFSKSFTQNEMSSTSDMGLKVPRYMKFKISNNHGSGSHTFTLKGAVLGATLA
jgi:hypothetical protein